MRSSCVALACLTAAAALSACFAAPEVYQGEVVSFDAGTQVVVVRDERPPHQEMSFVVAGGELGAGLQPGDEVRLAFVRERDHARALRVMNLTRQAEVGGKGKAGGAEH